VFSSSVGGSFGHTLSFLQKMKDGGPFKSLDKYGKRGVDALRSATPIETGRAASSWGFQIEHKRGAHKITWTNDDIEGGVNVAVILQYGHGTGTGGYVTGIDYINPALRPIFDQIAEEMWQEVRNA
jgi:hypothetical protein